MLMPALEQRISELVRQERQRLAPGDIMLASDPELAGVARTKSADMAARNQAAHVSRDGETSASIIMAKDAEFHGLLGENIAAQPFFPKYGVDVESVARRIMAIWLTSKPHRANLTDPDYARTGIGAAVSGDTVYVTELFSGPQDGAGQPPQTR